MHRLALILPAVLAGCADLPEPVHPPAPDQVGGLPGSVDVPLSHGLTLSVETGEMVRLLLTDARPRPLACGAVVTWTKAF